MRILGLKGLKTTITKKLPLRVGVRGPGFGVRGFPRLLGSLSNDVFEQHTSTGSGLFALLSRYFERILGQIVSIRVRTLSHTNLVASRRIKREKGSLSVEVQRSKTLPLKLPIMNVTPAYCCRKIEKKNRPKQNP